MAICGGSSGLPRQGPGEVVTLFLFGPLFDYSRDNPGLAVYEEFLFPQDFAAGPAQKPR
jgi:hypothetical protein